MEYVLNIFGSSELSFKKAAYPFLRVGQHLKDHFIPHPRNNYRPHILGERALALYSGLLIAVKIFVLTLVALGPIVPAFSEAITPENIIALTNQSRQEYNLASLTENSELDAAAQAKANDMLAKGYFAHVTPSGQTPWDFITAAGYNYIMAGENLAVNFTAAEDVETAWMNSPEHKANLLNPNFINIGVGVSQGEYQNHSAIFVVQEFGTPSSQQVTINNTPTPVQTSAVPPPKAAALSSSVASSRSQASSTNATSSLATAGNSLLTTLSSPQTLGDNQNLSPDSITVQSGNINLQGNAVEVTAQVNGPAVKVLAYFGQQAIMLSPQTASGTWSGQIPISSLSQAATTVSVEALNIGGQKSDLQLADFSPDTFSNYNPGGTPPASYVSLFGHTVDPNLLERNFYLLFIAAMLASLILAIGIKKHIQHLPLIVNSSFVVILACLLFMSG